MRPPLHDARLQHVTDQANELFIVDPFPQQLEQDVMVNVLEEPSDMGA